VTTEQFTERLDALEKRLAHLENPGLLNITLRNGRKAPWGHSATHGRTAELRDIISKMSPGWHFDLAPEHFPLWRHLYSIAREVGAKIRTEKQTDGRLTVWRVK
jgi:hypothetical protein